VKLVRKSRQTLSGLEKMFDIFSRCMKYNADWLEWSWRRFDAPVTAGLPSCRRRPCLRDSWNTFTSQEPTTSTTSRATTSRLKHANSKRRRTRHVNGAGSIQDETDESTICFHWCSELDTMDRDATGGVCNPSPFLLPSFSFSTAVLKLRRATVQRYLHRRAAQIWSRG